jgi:hypothetical protein
VVTDAILYSDGNGWIETFTAKGTTHPVIAIDRLRVRRNVMTGTPPNTPGGPPDGQTAVRTIDFTLPSATGFVTTPPTCPAKRKWITRARFRFADDTTQSVHSRSPCTHHR